jgi:hypothetical protein
MSSFDRSQTRKKTKATAKEDDDDDDDDEGDGYRSGNVFRLSSGARVL